MRAALGLLLTCAVAAPQGAPVASAMAALVTRYEPFGFTGVVMVAVGGEPLLRRGCGLADAATGRKNAPDTLFEIASITKSFTAAAVLKLAEQGRLGLDDPIAEHLPGVPEHSRAITVRHLLSHTSGVPGRNGRGRGEDLEAAVIAFLGDGPQREPGAQWEYWNGGYALLAGVVERCSGRSYTDYLRDELFAPADMQDSGFTGCDWLDPGRAAVAGGRSALDHPYGSYGYQYRGMGGMVTTAGDLLKWDRALAAGKVLSAESTAAMFAPVAKARGRAYALGWFVWQGADGVRRQQHGGAVRGFLSDFRRLPERDACIAVLHNGDDRILPYLVENLECLLLGAEPRHPLPPEVVAVDAAKLGRCAGTYRKGALRVEIRVEGDHLVAAPSDDAALHELLGRKVQGATGPVVLRPTGPTTFVHYAWYGASQLEFAGRGKARSFDLKGQAWKRVDD